MGNINMPIVSRSQKLAHVVQAYTLTEDMPPSTRTMLRNHVRGILLLVTAGETAAVTECVLSLRNSVSGVTGAVEQSVVDWEEIIVRRCNDVLAVSKG